MYLKKSDMNMLVEYLSIGSAKGNNRSAISPGKGGGGGGGTQ